MQNFTRRLIILSLLSFLTISALNAQQLTGKVTDLETGEPLIGSTITLLKPGVGNPFANSTAGLNGGFIFKNIPAGTYALGVKYVGFNKKDTSITISGSGKDIVITLERSKTPTLNEVTVSSSGSRGSDRSVFLADRTSPNIQNSVSARTIELAPDLSVANTAQRISGVSLERSTNGEGQFVIIRGMDKRYIYTLVNGIKIPSPDNKNRYVPLDIFPNDLLEKLQITKSLTPNMEGDAIGGAVNMVMKDAPYKFSATANLGLGYAGKFFNQDFIKFDREPSLSKSPRILNGPEYLATMNSFPNSAFSHSLKANPIATQGNFTVGGRLFNKKLGVLVGGSYFDNYRNVNSVFFQQNTEGGNAQLSKEQQRNYSIRQQRTGLQAKFDYDINADNKITLSGMYVNLTKAEYKFASDTTLTLARPQPGTGRIENASKTVFEQQQISNATLNGNHTIGNFIIDWTAAYSKATLNRPDEATLNSNSQVVVGTDGKLVATQEKLENSTREFSRSSDEDKSGYLNLSYKSIFGNTKVNWAAGGMYRNKTRNSDYDKYILVPEAGDNLNFNGDISNHTFTVSNPQGTSANGLNYNATENVGAAYAMATINWNNLTIVGGARYENTHFSWENAEPAFAAFGHTGDIKYYDVLPSAMIKYMLNKKQALRFSYYSAISRPNFYEVIPHILQGAEDDYAEEGNPYLKHSTSNNIDLKYEYYLSGVDQVLAGVFYKRIKNPIEYALTNNGNIGDPSSQGSNGTFLYYTAENFGNANNYGFELDITKYWRWFGVKANYTFTNSNITTTKVASVSDNSLVEEKRPLQGQAKHIANLSLLYKDDNKLGLNAQLAFNYTSRRINTVSAYYNQDIWQKGFAQLDFSVEKKLAKKWFVYAKVNNILNTPFQLEMLQKYTGAGMNGDVPHQVAGNNIFIRKDTYGTNYLLGVKFKF